MSAGVQCGGAGTVGHQAGVYKNVQTGSLQGGFAQHGGAACIRYRQHAALGGVLLGQRNALGAFFHDLQRHRAGSIQRRFQHGGLVGSLCGGVLRQAVGGGQRRKGFGVRLHQRFQLCAQGLGPGVQRLDLRLHGGILLFAGGQAAHHVAQRHAGSAYQRGCSAAARCGRFAGKLGQKLRAACVVQFHL